MPIPADAIVVIQWTNISFPFSGHGRYVLKMDNKEIATINSDGGGAYFAFATVRVPIGVHDFEVVAADILSINGKSWTSRAGLKKVNIKSSGAITYFTLRPLVDTKPKVETTTFTPDFVTADLAVSWRTFLGAVNYLIVQKSWAPIPSDNTHSDGKGGVNDFLVHYDTDPLQMVSKLQTNSNLHLEIRPLDAQKIQNGPVQVLDVIVGQLPPPDPITVDWKPRIGSFDIFLSGSPLTLYINPSLSVGISSVDVPYNVYFNDGLSDSPSLMIPAIAPPIPYTATTGPLFDWFNALPTGDFVPLNYSVLDQNNTTLLQGAGNTGFTNIP